MSFTLLDWLEAHSGLSHNLGLSGMKGELSSYFRYVRRPPSSTADEVRNLVARHHRVVPRRVFLVHGAHEGNALVLHFLAQALRRDTGRTPRLRVGVPEYPPIHEAAVWAGFLRSPPTGQAELMAGSNPNNPEGRCVSLREWLRRARGCRFSLCDETFREFCGADSLSVPGRAGLWTTGTLTKFYAADDVRVGWVIAPPESVEPFGRFLGVTADGIAGRSIDAAAALLRHRVEVAREVGRIFQRNLADLKSKVPGAPSLQGPTWFDRGAGSLDGDALGRAAASKGVLVCPGSFFGDAAGVRICLTRRTFPEDLDAYLKVRSRFVRRGGEPTSKRSR